MTQFTYPPLGLDKTGLATSSNQTAGNASLASIDTKTPALGQAVAASSQPVVLTAAQLTTLTPLTSVGVNNFPATQAVTGTFFQATQPVSAAALPLPSGAATSANQATEIASLASIDNKTPVLGQALAAASQPVVLTATQLSTLTPLTSVTTSSTDLTSSGSITTQNLVPAGTATASSSVSTGAMNGQTTMTIQVTGTYTGALSLQGTIDGTNWVTCGGLVFSNINTSAQTATITSGSVGIWQADISGFSQARLTALSAVTGTATIAIRSTIAVAFVGLDVALPTGSNTIGAISNTSFTATQATGTNLHTVVDSGTVTANAGTGTFTIAGTVTANAGTNLNTSLLALDSTVAKDSSLSTLNTSVNTLLKPSSTLAAVTSVGAIASTVTIKADTPANQANALKVDASATTQPVSAAALPLPTGAATSALQSTQDASINSLLKPASTLAAVTTVSTVTTVGAVTAITNALPAGTNVIGALSANQSINVSQIAGTTTATNAGPSNAGTLRSAESNVATATVTSVASSATTVSLFASNASRRGAAIFNESTTILYVKFGATASLTSYTVQVGAGGYYEIPQPCYSGAIDGIWAAANGSARLTEY